MGIMLRNSERKTFKRCQTRWWWSWREGLVNKEVANPLWFGTGIHLALAEWYCGPGTKRGPHPAETWKKYAGDTLKFMKVFKPVGDEQIATWEDLAALGETLMTLYVEEYGTDPSWHIIQPEQTFGIDIPWPDEQDIFEVDPTKPMLTLHGTYDLVYRDLDTGWLWLGEHKTAKAIRTGHLPLDDQAGTYWAVASRTLQAMGLIKPKEGIQGINYNYIRKSLPDERPKDREGYATNNPVKAHYLAALEKAGANPSPKQSLAELQAIAEGLKITVLGERSKIQPKPIFERHVVNRTRRERAVQLRRIQREGFQMMLARNDVIELTKNPTLDCEWDCPFYAMCELQETSGNWREFRDLQYRVEDPYADHRKSTEE